MVDNDKENMRVIHPHFKIVSMDEDCRRYVFDFINDFWHERSDFKSWHKI